MKVVIDNLARKKLEEKNLKDKYIKVYFGGFG